MNTSKNNIAANLRYLRVKSKLSQEVIAERVGVSRQAVAKWENGDSLPDIVNCEVLADLFEVSLNDLVRHDPEKMGMPIAPLNKHMLGTVTIGERGQVVLPKKARDLFHLSPGDMLVVLGDTNPVSEGIALIRSENFLRMAGQGADYFMKGEGGPET